MGHFLSALCFSHAVRPRLAGPGGVLWHAVQGVGAGLYEGATAGQHARQSPDSRSGTVLWLGQICRHLPWCVAVDIMLGRVVVDSAGSRVCPKGAWLVVRVTGLP